MSALLAAHYSLNNLYARRAGLAQIMKIKPQLYMCITCLYAECMAVMIQIRNVPDALHRRLKSRAALAGMSLSDYLLGEIRQAADRPTLDELRARLQARAGVSPSVSPADAVRAERDRP